MVTMTSENLVKKYLADNDISDFKELSRKTNIDYTRLRKHIKNPRMLRVFEIQSLDDVLHFTLEDLALLVRGLTD